MNELRQKRKELGLTQAQAAFACGVSRRTYQTYEETRIVNATYDELLRKLNEAGFYDGSKYVCNIRQIKNCFEMILSAHPQIRCAYLFGSYARGEATGKSDIDLLLVCEPMGMEFYGIAADLEELLHKEIDLHTHRQLLQNETLLREVLKEGVKVYG